MIVSFRHKGLEDFYYDGTKKGIQPRHAEKLADVLLHRLQPRKDNRWAIKVSGNWRITFRFERGDAYDVDYEDYH